MPRDRGGRTYRIRQIPSSVSKDSLTGTLVNVCPELGPEENIIICSLASSLVPFETPRTKTATVNFRTLPGIFDNDDTEWVLSTADHQPNVIVDIHFLGFTALNDVDSDLHVLDCISISGLASHPFGSWADRNPQSNFMWLRDRLPQDLKQVRSIIYGYDSRLLQSESFQGIDDIAITFIAQLKSIGRSLKAAKPAVVLAHSLGGIILKCALLEMANSSEVERYMLNSIKEVIFFGVPNKGMEMEQWLPMVEGQPNEALVRLLAPGSQDLIDLDERFNGISNVRNMRLVSFFETQRSQTAERNLPTGKWTLSGPLKVLVDKNSAQQAGSEKSDIIPINKSHSDMVKFREGSEEYQIVARYIHELIKSVNNQSFGSHGPAIDDGMPEQLTPPVPLAVELSTDIAYCMLRSLDLGDTRYRFEIIEEAYGQTFEWIWKDTDSGFPSWLNSGSGIYWISGKPGSGKSTLMKYIFQNYQKKVLLNKGSMGQIHISAGFFFHDRGSHLQKSFEGLLYSILHQVLSSEKGFIKEVSYIYSRRPDKHRAQWPLGDLEEALNCILKQTRLPVDILLFLDALDEYGGRPDFIVDFIQKMTNASRNSGTQVKICFSSRLWNIFIDHFRVCPGFKIHKRTKQDILAYIHGKFNDSPSMAQLLRQESDNQDSRISALTSGLVDRAEGVFLWVKLVVDELLNASREGAIASELLEILASFPKELDELYTELIKRIPKEFRAESYAMLEIVLRSASEVFPYDFWLATACASCNTLEDCISKILSTSFVPSSQMGDKFSDNEGNFGPKVRNPFDFKHGGAIEDIEQYKRRLKSRCGGLIEEVSYQIGVGEPAGKTLQFMHQTVKDFVSKPGFRQIITNEDKESKENGYSMLAKYGLAQFVLRKRGPPVSDFLLSENSKWSEYLWYGSRAELSTGRSQKYLLDAASDAFLPDQNEENTYHNLSSAASFGVISNLQLYIRECLLENEGIALWRLMGHGRSNISTLLHDLVRTVIDSKSWVIYENEMIQVEDGSQIRQMANILLDAGANRSAIYKEKTPFQSLFQTMNEDHSESRRAVSCHFKGVVQAFLQHGQDPNTDLRGCKPLHLVNSPLAQILLNYGADVNALDEKGLTPLDIAFGAARYTPKFGYRVQREVGHRLALLLLDHGGCVTTAGASSVPRFLKSLTRHSAYPLDSLDERLKNPPRPQKSPLMERIFNRLSVINDSSPSSVSLQNNENHKSSRFKKALPRLFKKKDQ